MALETELAVYDRELPNLLKDHEGQWVLIHGDTVDSFWQSEDDAYLAGCDRFGLEPFLIMPVKVEDPLRTHLPLIPRD
jgi:hypothetical protein